MKPSGELKRCRTGKPVKYRVCYEMYDGYYEMFFDDTQREDAVWFADWLRVRDRIYDNVHIIDNDGEDIVL